MHITQRVVLEMQTIEAVEDIIYAQTANTTTPGWEPSLSSVMFDRPKSGWRLTVALQAHMPQQQIEEDLDRAAALLIAKLRERGTLTNEAYRALAYECIQELNSEIESWLLGHSMEIERQIRAYLSTKMPEGTEVRVEYLPPLNVEMLLSKLWKGARS